MNGLFIGRFQPFHKGHLSAIEQALTEVDHLYIGIGSSEENFRPTNPFTCAERIQMITAALKEAKIAPANYTMIPVPNIHNFALWPDHVELYVPPFENLYTGSEVVKTLYQTINQKRKKPYLICEVHKEFDVSSTEIRQLLLEQKSWQHLVPPVIADLLKKWRTGERLKAIQEAEK